MSGIIHVQAQRINTDTAGLTGANAPLPENIPTASIIERIVNPSDWGGLGNLFTDLVPTQTPSNVLTKPVAPVGNLGGGVITPPANPILPTFLGPTVTRIRTVLGI